MNVQHFPGRGLEPFIPPYTPPRGRWEWIPDYNPSTPPPFWPQCSACRNGGVCMCVRPERDVVFLTIATKTGVSNPGDLKLG